MTRLGKRANERRNEWKIKKRSFQTFESSICSCVSVFNLLPPANAKNRNKNSWIRWDEPLKCSHLADLGDLFRSGPTHSFGFHTVRQRPSLLNLVAINCARYGNCQIQSSGFNLRFSGHCVCTGGLFGELQENKRRLPMDRRLAVAT